MSGTETRTRLALLDELAQIVGAMKNLAYAELQRLNRLLEAQQTSENVLFQSLQDLWPESLYTHSSKASTDLWLALGSERGFCGGFNDQLAEAVLTQQAHMPETRWLIAGERLQQRLNTQLVESKREYIPSSNGSEDCRDCVERWTETLAKHLFYPPDAGTLQVLFQSEHGVITRQLLPFWVPNNPPRRQPKTYLSTAQLWPPLLLELIRVQLLGIQFSSLQQENLARLAQMRRAQDHLDETRQQLRQTYFRQRQADITGELETLMSSLDRLTLEHAPQPHKKA